MKRSIYVVGGLLAAALAYWAVAQPAPAPLPGLFPAGALLYLEAKDFAPLVADWNGSAEKRAWLSGANYQNFSRSRLFLKLGQAQNEFAAAAGVPPDYALLESVAGGNSALAIYDIGNLEFLYVTHLALARAMNTALWKARGSYQTRRAGGVEYYLKENTASHRVAAFAYAGDTLFIATREDLIAGALELSARQVRPAVATEKWFVDATQAAAPGANDLRLVYNMERLLGASHFRSYWVQRNATELGQFSSGLADLERVRGEVRERRVLLRPNGAAGLGDETAAGQVLAAVPDDAGFYRAWLQPGADRAERWIEEKLFSAGARAAVEQKQAPAVETTPEAGAERDLETRIDEAPVTDDRGATAFQALRERLAATPLDAMLTVESTRAGDVFVGTQSAMVLLANRDWDAGAVRDALAQAAGSLWSVAGVGALGGLGKIAVSIDGHWLVLGDSADLVNAIVARRNRPAAAGAAYAAGWRHARELPNFERMTRMIDFPQIMPGAGDQAREPMFFSENMASLGRALGRVQSAEMVVHDAGAVVRETLVYKVAP